MIDEKVWNLEVIQVTSFTNGEPIPEARTKEEWIKAGLLQQPAWCNFNNDPENGRLYNWYAVNRPAGLAPRDWHIQTNEEWTLLTKQLGGEMMASKNLRGMGANLITSSGIRDSAGIFSSRQGAWWSKTNLDLHYGLMRFSYPNKDFLLRSMGHKMEGLSVLYIKD